MDQYSLTAFLSLMLVAGPLASQPSQAPVSDAKELLRVTIHPSALGQAILRGDKLPPELAEIAPRLHELLERV